MTSFGGETSAAEAACRRSKPDCMLGDCATGTIVTGDGVSAGTAMAWQKTQMGWEVLHPE